MADRDKRKIFAVPIKKETRISSPAAYKEFRGNLRDTVIDIIGRCKKLSEQNRVDQKIRIALMQAQLLMAEDFLNVEKELTREMEDEEQLKHQLNVLNQDLKEIGMLIIIKDLNERDLDLLEKPPHEIISGGHETETDKPRLYLSSSAEGEVEIAPKELAETLHQMFKDKLEHTRVKLLVCWSGSAREDGSMLITEVAKELAHLGHDSTDVIGYDDSVSHYKRNESDGPLHRWAKTSPALTRASTHQVSAKKVLQRVEEEQKRIEEQERIKAALDDIRKQEEYLVTAGKQHLYEDKTLEILERYGLASRASCEKVLGQLQETIGNADMCSSITASIQQYLGSTNSRRNNFKGN